MIKVGYNLLKTPIAGTCVGGLRVCPTAYKYCSYGVIPYTVNLLPSDKPCLEVALPIYFNYLHRITTDYSTAAVHHRDAVICGQYSPLKEAMVSPVIPSMCQGDSPPMDIPEGALLYGVSPCW